MSNADAEAAKALGNEALKAQKFQEAVDHYSKAIELDPKNRVYYSNRSNALLQLQKYEEALADANQTIEIDPQWPRGYGRKGVALFYLKRYQQAAEAYEAGVKLDPSNESYRQESARCAAFLFAEPFLRPDWAGMLQASSITAALMQDPKFVSKIQGIRSNPSTLQAAFSSDPELQQAYLVLSGKEQEMREKQMRDEAQRAEASRKRREELKKKEEEEAERKKKEEFEALPKNKQEALLAKDAGNAAYKEKNLEEALAQYVKAAELDPESCVFHTNQAAVYMAQKEYEKAIKACDRAIEVAKEFFADYELLAKAYFRKGKALAKLDRWKECVEAYDTGLLSSRDPTAVKFRNQADERLKEAEQLAYQDPEKGEEAKKLGNEFFAKGSWGDAIRAYSDAVKRNPNNHVYYSNRAIAYSKVREYTLMLQDADKCVELDPSFIKGWVRKGMAHHYLKEYYKALEAYDKGMKIDPNYAELAEWTQKTTQAINRMHTAGGKEDAEAARQKAMADPEIQKVLRDPEIQTLMRTLQGGDRKAAEQMLQKSQTLYANYEKLSKAGLM